MARTRARQRQRGHVRRRGNSFQVLVYAGVDPVTGKPNYLTESTQDESQVDSIMRRLVSEVDEQRNARTKATLGAAIDAWLNVHDVEENTRRSYEMYTRRYVKAAAPGRPGTKALADVPSARSTSSCSKSSMPSCAGAATDATDGSRSTIGSMDHTSAGWSDTGDRQAGHRRELYASTTARPRSASLSSARRTSAGRCRPPAFARSTSPSVQHSAPRCAGIGSSPTRRRSPRSPACRPPSRIHRRRRRRRASWPPPGSRTTTGARSSGSLSSPACAVPSCSRCAGTTSTWPTAIVDIRRNYVWINGRGIEKTTKTHRMRRVSLDTATVEVLTAHHERYVEAVRVARGAAEAAERSCSRTSRRGTGRTIRTR